MIRDIPVDSDRVSRSLDDLELVANERDSEFLVACSLNDAHDRKYEDRNANEPCYELNERNEAQDSECSTCYCEHDAVVNVVLYKRIVLLRLDKKS